LSAAPFVLLEPGAPRRADGRGHLDVLYEVGDLVLKRSFSRQGVFRGMHWQRAPHLQTKLIRVVSGAILDFVVDPQHSAPAPVYRREIRPADGWVRIDAHWAHGFYALQDTDFEYICHGAYNEAAESSLSIAAFLREQLGLTDLTLSAKDAAAQPLPVVDGGLLT
jgi:dTDP-4-dehydrorhamnose 3,5-epimerase